jgi:protein required for attachment to host cells
MPLALARTRLHLRQVKPIPHPGPSMDKKGNSRRVDKMKQRNWLLVANAARARVLEETSLAGRYLHVADLVHPQSRQKGVQLASDRPGHVMSTGHGPGSTAYAPHTDPREREHERFAHEVAQWLNDGVASGRCAGIVLVASNPFLGEVKSRLSESARKSLLRSVPIDLTDVPDAELAQRIAAA